jgi:Reverse transcriptase (RNA-dependent DNA polymerase)
MSKVPSVVDLDLSPLMTDSTEYAKEAAFLTQGGGQDKRLLPIVLDTGASTSITPYIDDFVGPLEPASVDEIRGISGTTRVVGKGTVEWLIRDYWNVVRSVRTTAYYVPDINIRLFCPQAYFQEHESAGRLICDAQWAKLEVSDGTVLEFPFQQHCNLPFMLLDEAFQAGAHISDVAFLAEPSNYGTLMSVTEATNRNLQPSQRELLLLHQKLGHAGFQWCQRLCQQPREPALQQIIVPKIQGVSTCVPPMCAACQMAKQSRRYPERNKDRSSSGSPNEMAIRQGDLRPGDCVSMDQYISALPGRLPNTKGKESLSDRYKGGTMFVDHATGFLYLRNQVVLTAGSTLQSKKQFEEFASNFGIKIKRYRADNVPFRSEAFLRNIADSNQTIDFSGVGAHHQNGVAERSIQTVTRWARAMLLHAVLMWPDHADLTLWPFALEQAVYLWNHLPRQDTRTAPLELFSSTRFPSYHHLWRLHVWGCPAYVLDPKLQDGKKIPKWQPRSRRGQYLGVATDHSSTIGRILNLATGHISPQYHVVYDDHFTTVPNSESGGMFHEAPFDANKWETLVSSGLESVFDPDDTEAPRPSLHDDWLSPEERAHRDTVRLQRRPTVLPNPPPVMAPEGDSDGGPIPSEGATDAAPTLDELSLVDHNEIQQTVEPLNIPVEIQIQPPTPATRTTRSGREIRSPKRLITTMFASGGSTERNPYRNPKRKVHSADLNHQYLMALEWTRLVEQLRSADLRAMMYEVERFTDFDSGTVEWMHPMILAAKANAEDNPTFEQAMNGPDREGYLEACKKELKTLGEDKDAWDVVEREPWMNVLPSTWAFRCKRYPDGMIRKLKARFCARGDRQIEGVDFFDTFAPVVNWTTVRLMLIMSIILGLATKQVDYTAAFVHAPIDKDPNWESMTPEEQERSGVYLEMSRGFREQGKVLKLKRSLYGLRQSPRNFFQHLKSKLESVGFIADDSVDPCLFISDKVICLVYVDDTLFFSPKVEYIDEVIQQLRDSEMELEVEDSVAGFLGVHIERDAGDGSIHLTQKGLAKRVVDALNVGHLPRKLTPASSVPLVKDEDGEPPNGAFNFASVVGMLQYLQGHSRPDITYAVSQCARFVHSPRRSHEKALEQIGQYLKGTLDEGLVLRPTDNLDIDVYVDADFAGLWPHEDKQDPTCVKSRTGFVICIAGCPVIWQSKLQHEIALSTMEAEYNALSFAMRSVLPFQRTVKAIAHGIGLDDERATHFKTTVWEDNAGALTLANMEPGRITPRSKHYAIKYHWFRSHLKPNKVDIWIPTSLACRFRQAELS